MLNEHQFELLPQRIYERLNAINSEYLIAIGEIIGKIGKLRPADVHRLQQMYNYGADMDRVIAKLVEVSGKNAQEIYEIFDIAAREQYNYTQPFYEAKGKKFIPYEENTRLKRYVKSVARQTVKEYANLTQHTAFAVFDKGKKSIAPLFMANKDKAATSLSDTYTKIVDYAVSKVQLGGESYQSAMREVIRAMSESGIRTVDYATGYSRRLDSAVRQNILWGVRECNRQTAKQTGEEFGADGCEISYHSNPRPSHEEMGGRQYAYGKARRIRGRYYPSFSTVAHLLEDYNCYHFEIPIVVGISEPAYDDDELARMRAEDKKKIEFEGKEYTKYEASQVQRTIETKVRHLKDRANMAKAAGDDELRRRTQERINLLTGKYDKFSKAAGLPTQRERMQVAGFRRVKTKAELTSGGKNDIIKVNSDKVFNEAAKGNRHSGTYADATKKTRNQLQKSISNHEKQIDIHIEKINNPSKYDKNWSSKTQQQKDGLLKKWQKDATRNAEQAAIERRIFDERFRK